MSETLEFLEGEHWEEIEITLDRSKSENEPLGFRITGGIDGVLAKYNFKSIYITNIYKNSLADKDKQLKLYDIILRVNNEDFQNILCQTALQILRTSGNIVQLKVRRIKENLCEDIELKHNGKLGISIAGGIGNTYIKQDPGIFVTNLCQNFPNEQLAIGDRLIKISSENNTYDLRFVPFEEAKKYIKLACSQSKNIILKVAHIRHTEQLQIDESNTFERNYERLDSKNEESENEEPLIVPFDIDDYERYEKRCKLYNDHSSVDLLPITNTDTDQVKIIYRIVTIETIDIHGNEEPQKTHVD